MNSGPDGPPDHPRSHWLTDLVVQIFSDRVLIPAGRCLAYDAFLGVILIAISVLMIIEPGHGSTGAAIAVGGAGLALESGLAVMAFRPTSVPRSLVVGGATIVALALALAVGSVVWALRAPPEAPYRYAPGLTLVLLVFGTHQVATFGPWHARAKRLRGTALAAGIVCELAVAGALLLRALP